MTTLMLRSLFATLFLLLGFFTVPTGGGPIGVTLGTPAFAQQECSAPRAAASRAEQQQYQDWCRQTAARDAQGAAGSTLAAAGGPAEVWCPPWSKQCYCWNGKHYNGCLNFAAHCTDGLTCGPGGKVCHCTSK
ncbi:hypothetical protein KXS07_21485 [Inquilinus limosus]|uniref:hypothetical protein n=1 Tax=Inquilinus limosus TaxID=171674 RepID=UPI003F16200D